MNLKDLFAKAENGVLSYDQLVALIDEAKAKFVDLSEGGYTDTRKYTDDLAARDTRISSLEDTVKTRDSDLAKLQKQLEEASTDTTKIGDLTKQLSDLQKQYEKETKALDKQMKEQNYRHAVNDFANKQNFSSQAAKRDFVNSMLAKNLQMEGDTIIGATDFVSAYTKDNEDAFTKQTEEPPTQTKPHFAGPTGGTSSTGNDDADLFSFDFVGVRPHK